jgi:hypothetical protein
MEGAKCFKNVPLTISVRSQLRLSTIFHSGLFNEEPFCVKKTEPAGNQLSKLLLPTDLLSDSVVIQNTEYRQSMLLILGVHSQDKVSVGWLKKVVLRGKKVFFLVTKHVCYRSQFGYFESVGNSTVTLSSREELRSFKPLLPRGSEQSFIFFLHGKLLDD